MADEKRDEKSDEKNAGKTDKQQLIDGILQDAQSEAERIREEARKTIEERKRATENRVNQIRSEAEKTAQQRADEIRSHAEKTLGTERRRNMLKRQEQLTEEVLTAVRRRFAELQNEPEYRDILRGWIVEAALGLGVEEARVNASRAERELLPDVLPEAAEEIRRVQDGKEMRLEEAEANPLAGQGVLLTSADGSIAYSNQVETRLLRYQSEIRRLIHKRLFQRH